MSANRSPWFLVLICMRLMKAQWISYIDVPILSVNNDPIFRFGIGYYNNTITILGGGGWNDKSVKSRDIIDLYTWNDEFTVHNDILPEDVWGYSQYFTQTDNILYFIKSSTIKDRESTSTDIQTYDLSTKQFTPSYCTITEDMTVDAFSCIASTREALFIAGGRGGNSLSIFNLSSISSIWTSGPPMNEPRGEWTSCVVSPSSGNLYAIGGYRQQNNIDRLDSVEYISVINIHQNQWTFTNGKLNAALNSVTSIAHDDFVYVIGGYNGEWVSMFHIIDTIGNTINLSPDTLYFGVSSSAAIIVGNILYSFGGMIVDAKGTKQSQYTIIDTSQPTTTMPTTTLDPTAPPTRYPNIASTIQTSQTSTMFTSNTDEASSPHTSYTTHPAQISQTSTKLTSNTDEAAVTEVIDYSSSPYTSYTTQTSTMFTSNADDDAVTEVASTYINAINIANNKRNDGVIGTWVVVFIIGCVFCIFCLFISLVFVMKMKKKGEDKEHNKNELGEQSMSLSSDLASGNVVTKKDVYANENIAADEFVIEDSDSEKAVKTAGIEIEGMVNEGQKCYQCGSFREGKVDRNDQQFYCFDCWAQYESVKRATTKGNTKGTKGTIN